MCPTYITFFDSYIYDSSLDADLKAMFFSVAFQVHLIFAKHILSYIGDTGHRWVQVSVIICISLTINYQQVF